MALGLTVRASGIAAADRLIAGLGPAVRVNLRRTVEEQTILLQRHVVEDKLTGQVLNVRSGTLRRSITYRVEEDARGIRGIVGTNLPYGAAHEFGMTVHIPEIRPRTAKALHFVVGGREVFAMRARAHDVRLPERSFLRSALRDRAAEFVAAVRHTIQATITALRAVK